MIKYQIQKESYIWVTPGEGSLTFGHTKKLLGMVLNLSVSLQVCKNQGGDTVGPRPWNRGILSP